MKPLLDGFVESELKGCTLCPEHPPPHMVPEVRTVWVRWVVFTWVWC